MAPSPLTSWLAVLLVLPLAASLETPFNVYGSCLGGVGICRQRSPASSLSSAGRGPTAAAGQPDPLQKITMRFPCTEASNCKEVSCTAHFMAAFCVVFLYQPLDSKSLSWASNCCTDFARLLVEFAAS
jgi:hypothetical protein